MSVASDIYSELCHFYTNKLCSVDQPKRGLLARWSAIGKIQYDTNTNKCRENQLTTVHADLLQLSLASKNFSLALKLTQKNNTNTRDNWNSLLELLSNLSLKTLFLDYSSLSLVFAIVVVVVVCSPICSISIYMIF